MLYIHFNGRTMKAEEAIEMWRKEGLTEYEIKLGGLNDKELQTVAIIAFRSHGFRNLTADDVMTLAAITCMDEFRQEDR